MTDLRAQRAVAPSDPPSARSPAHSRAPQELLDDPFVLLAYSTLQREMETLRGHWPPSDRPPTPSEIHQSRVATRRLRVGLRLFRRMLPSREAARLRNELRGFASSLGEARDLDVYADNFRNYSVALPPVQHAELSGYELYLRRARADARQKATAAIADVRTATLLDDIADFVADGPSTAALRRWRSLTVRNGIRESIRCSTARVRRLGNALTERSPPAAFHELRIKTKRLRYELEFFSAIYPALEHTAKLCKALQDLLGTHQDACTATARLRRYAALLKKSDASAALPPALVQLRRDQLALARSVRRSFAEQWPAFAAVVDDARQTVA